MNRRGIFPRRHYFTGDYCIEYKISFNYYKKENYSDAEKLKKLLKI